MKIRKQGYDVIAGFYDKLAKLIFGNQLHQAQVAHLGFIPPYATLLLVGGGTGCILEDITKLHPGGLIIHYIDSSAEMIRLAKQRHTGANSLTFLQQSITTFSSADCYDVVITPFLLDNFSQHTAEQVFAILHRSLKQGGYWLYTDFQVYKKHSYLHKAALMVMYTFFRLTCNIEAQHLPDVTSAFAKFHYDLLSSQTYWQHFIVSSVYLKQAANE